MKNYINKLSKSVLLDKLKTLPFYLYQEASSVDLTKIYEGWHHSHFNATIVGNMGANLLVKSPLLKKYSIIKHIGFTINIHGYGLEIANVAIYGDLKRAPFIILRTESACPPSFLFESQRCNCYDQWLVARELSSKYHKISKPNFDEGKELEKYIRQFIPDYKNPAIILIYLDSQSGMGSGVLPKKYNACIGETAFIRHRGEYTAEQIYDISMSNAFSALGLKPDPRASHDNIGYKIPAIIMDCIGVRNDICILTNNLNKKKALEDMGYNVKRYQICGRYDVACQLETQDRINEFGHKIVYNKITDPLQEVDILYSKINSDLTVL